MLTLPTSKAAASRSGSRFFDTGAPCGAGHAGPRYTRGGTCVQCVRLANAARLGVSAKIGLRGRASIARAAAVTGGETTYQTDRPCPKGHAVRFTASDNCVECNAETLRREAEARKWARRLRLYGITQERFHEILRDQGAACPICTDALVELSKIHIDHCHDTGRVRGLLCGRCNQAIGLLREDVNSMQRAIAYVSH